MSVITLILSCICIDNYACAKLFGFSNSLLSTHAKNCGAFRCLAALAMCLSGAICLFVNGFVPAYLTLLVDVVVIMAVSCLVNKACNKTGYDFFLLFVLNGATLMLCVNNTLADGAVNGLLSVVGVTLGFVASMYIFDGVRSRISNKYVPDCFKGLPIEFVAASIIALAFYAFK